MKVTPKQNLFLIALAGLSLWILHSNNRDHEARIEKLEGASVSGQRAGYDGGDTRPRSVVETPATPAPSFSSMHDYMLGTFDPADIDHQHGEHRCELVVHGTGFVFEWDGKRWRQIEED